MFIPWSEDNKPPSSFLKRLKETQDKPSRDFLESVMDWNLEPNYRPRHYCTCPKVVKLSDIHVIQDAQARHKEQMDNPSTDDCQDRPPKPSRRPSDHSDYSDDEDSKDNQARAPIAKPMLQNPQPSTSSGTLRKPNTYPKVLAFGRGVMAPLANGFTMGCGHRCGHRLNINHTPQLGAPKVAMVSSDRVVTPDRVQTYDEMPAPVRPWHALANWTSVRLGNDPNTQQGNDEETGEQSQNMMIADSNVIDITSEESDSTDDDDLEY